MTDPPADFELAYTVTRAEVTRATAQLDKLTWKRPVNRHSVGSAVRT